jgi:CheY-like chemotaxis protein
MADRGQLEQVIMNLAVNARDAMPEGGHLTIETGNIQLDEAFIAAKADLKLKPGDYVMLAISDTGFGMDATVQAHIFEPFFTTKEVGFGTGLGLATTQGIVEQSGGYIQVYSAPRAGTTFKIYLPRADEIAEKSAFQAEASGLETLKGNETILVVEDEEAVRTLIRRVLAQSGYAVLTVAHGKEALALFEAKESSTPIDLVLTDLVMPQMGGVELVEKLKQSQPNLKVIGMSGYTDGVVARKNIFRLVDTYLQKPFTPSGLLNKVREVLDTQEQELR